MKLELESFERYARNPLDDGWLRSAYRIPDDRYYTVSVWPIAGVITVDNRTREVRSKKISKSSG